MSVTVSTSQNKWMLSSRSKAYSIFVSQLHTTRGDLKVELFCEAVPKTAEVRHGRREIVSFSYHPPWNLNLKLLPN